MRLNHVVLAILIAFIWGMNFVVIHLGLREISPVNLFWIRFFLVSFPAIFFIKRPLVPFKKVIIYSLFMFILQFLFLFSGMRKGMPAGFASIFMQTQVFFTIFLACIFSYEKLNKWQVMGALVSFSGLILFANHLGNNISLAGFILIIAAACSWSIGNLASKKMGGINMLSLIIWSSFIAWPPVLIFSLFFDGVNEIVNDLAQISWLSMLSVIYIVYASTLFAFTAWCWLLSKYPAAIVAPFTFLVPVFGALGSSVFLGEFLVVWQCIAALLIMIGLFINILIPQIILAREAAVKHKKLIDCGI